jgi:hypothetical protein
VRGPSGSEVGRSVPPRPSAGSEIASGRRSAGAYGRLAPGRSGRNWRARGCPSFVLDSYLPRADIHGA